MAVPDFAGALITGGGRGIGAATARLLASRGARAIVTDRDGPAANDVAATLPPGCRGQDAGRDGPDAGAELFANLAMDELWPTSS